MEQVCKLEVPLKVEIDTGTNWYEAKWGVKMPEIAEVETVRNTLKRLILNKKIVDVKIIYPKIIESNY